MQDSIFSKIIRGEIPAHKIYEDDKVIAILTIEPTSPGHTLVIPKTQTDHVWDLPDEDYSYMWQIVKKLGAHIKKTLGSPRVGIVVEGFGVPHVHIYLIPIYKSNDLKKPDAKASNDELARMAKKLTFTA